MRAKFARAFQLLAFKLFRIVAQSCDQTWTRDLRVASGFGLVAAEYKDLDGCKVVAWEKGRGINHARAFGEDLQEWGQWAWATRASDADLKSGLSHIAAMRRGYGYNPAVAKRLEHFEAVICREMKNRRMIEEVEIGRANAG